MENPVTMRELILARRKGEGVRITNLVANETIDVTLKDIDKVPDRHEGKVYLEVQGGYANGEPSFKSGETLELTENLTLAITDDFGTSSRVRFLYKGPKEIYRILRHELLEEGSHN